MKNAFLYFIILIHILVPAHGHANSISCQAVVGETKVDQAKEIRLSTSNAAVKAGETIMRKRAPEEAAKLSQEFMDKKLLFSNLQFTAVLLAEPELFKNNNFKNRSSTENLERAIKEVKGRETPWKRKDLNKLAKPENFFNQADQNYVKDWMENSTIILDRMVDLLESPESEREAGIKLIRSTMALPDSKESIIESLQAIRKLRDEEPEKYNSFIEAWKATLPMAAAELPNKTRLGQFIVDGTIVAGATFAATVSTLILGADVSGHHLVMASMMTAVGSLMVGMLGGAVSGVQYLKNVLRGMTPATFKQFKREKVKSTAQTVLGMTDVQVKQLIENNGPKEREDLNRLQDLSAEELVSLLKEANKAEINNPEQVQAYQRLQMQIMLVLSNKFSILSERKDKIEEKIDQFVRESSKIAQLPEKDKRNKLGEISILYTDSYEFGIDINTLSRLVTEATDSMTLQVDALRSVLNRLDPEQSNSVVEQFIAKTAVLDGMKTSLEGLKDKVRKDAEMITQLSVGIMAGQVVDVQKFLRETERGKVSN